MDVLASGTVTDTVHFEMKYSDGGLPDGEIVVSRLDLLPNILPNSTDASPGYYWILNNYGNNPTFDPMDSLNLYLKEGSVSSSAINNPSSVSLYHRSDNEDADNWINKGTADHVVGGASNYFSFGSNTNVTTSGQYFIMSANDLVAVLPSVVEFNAVKRKDQTVRLSWHTVSEYNSDYFNVERSMNRTDWEPITRVEATGNINRAMQYADVDPAPFPGMNYYRLKMVDLNGRYAYSDLREIDMGEIEAIGLFPNPSDERVNVIGVKEYDRIEVISSFGEVVLSKKITKSGNGVVLNVSDLESAVYYIRISDDRKTKIVKLFVAH